MRNLKWAQHIVLDSYRDVAECPRAMRITLCLKWFKSGYNWTQLSMGPSNTHLEQACPSLYGSANAAQDCRPSYRVVPCALMSAMACHHVKRGVRLCSPQARHQLRWLSYGEVERPWTPTSVVTPGYVSMGQHIQFDLSSCSRALSRYPWGC